MIKSFFPFSLTPRDYRNKGQRCPLPIVQFYAAEVILRFSASLDFPRARLPQQRPARSAPRSEAREHPSPGHRAHRADRLRHRFIPQRGPSRCRPPSYRRLLQRRFVQARPWLHLLRVELVHLSGSAGRRPGVARFGLVGSGLHRVPAPHGLRAVRRRERVGLRARSDA